MARLSIIPLKVKEHFVNQCKQCCQDTSKRDSLQAVFEGLADITKFPDTKKPYFTEFVWFTDEETNENLCVINGRYRACKDEEAVAVAIGVWDEAKGCCSALSKLKDGRNLPAPFRVKGIKNSKDMDSICAMAHTILKDISRFRTIEKALARFKMYAQKQQ